MRKLFLLPACLVCTVMVVQAQKKQVPPPPPPQPPKIEMEKFLPPSPKKEAQEFYSRNPSVARMGWQAEHQIVIFLKDNTKEKYNLFDEKEKKAFRDKYGEVPKMVPPPPPPKVNLTKFKPPQLNASGEEMNAFYKRNPSIANVHWGAKNKVFIKLKDGNKEEYDFANEAQKKKFEEKYGASPTPPPPPPPTKPKQTMKKLTPPKIKDPQ